MFYGWRMVGVAFGAHLVASGLAFYALPRLMVPLADEFTNGDRTGIAFLVLAMSLPGILVGPLIGRVLTRYPLRVVMAIAAGVMGVGFVAATQATALWHLMLVYALAVPVGVSAISGVGANALVANWFDRRRPLALGVSQFGLSIAGALVVFFISWTLDLGGWRATYAAFAALAFLTAPILYATITDRPSDRGLHPDGEEPHDPTPTSATSWTFGEAFRDRNLWLAGLTAGLCFAGATGMIQNGHAFATDAGHADSQADFVLAALSVGAAFGKLVFGALGVRFGERASMGVAVVSQGVFMALLPSAAHSLSLLLVTVLGLGLALGGIMPSLSALLARLYGAERFAAAMGYIAPMMIPIQMVGAPIAAFVSDRTGSYDLAIYGFALACGAALLLLLQIQARSASASR